jgi:polysaccharide biosynthesis/export protein
VRVHCAELESRYCMQHIPNLLFRLLCWAVAAAVFGSLQVAMSQDSTSSPNLGRQEDAAHPQDTSKEPLPPVQPLASPEKASQIEANSSALVLGPGDELEVTVYGAQDLSVRTRVSNNGNISIPLIGYVRVAGLSSSEAEATIEAELRKNNILNDPHVSVYAKEYTSSGISVAGEVAKPGFYSILGPHRLFDVLQAAGGTTDRAANKVIISHRNQTDPITLSISKDPAEMAASNIELRPGDTIVVPRAGIVYVLGEVIRPGGYVLNSSGGVTVLQVVAVAGGTTHLASAGKTRLLHRTDNGFQEQQIDVKKLLRGKIRDIAVHDQDILFVPTSGVKSVLNASAIVATATTVAIYRVP